MQTTEEMQVAGIHREVKMMALAKLGEMASDLGLILVSDNEIDLAEVLAGTVVAIGRRLEELNAENLASFQTYIGARQEVDQLEAMLHAGGEELECKLCAGDEAAELALDARMERDQERRENQGGA